MASASSSMLFSDCYSSTATRLCNGNGLVLPRCVFGQLRLQTTTVTGRGSVRSSSSPIPANSAVRNSETGLAKVIDGVAVAKTIRDEIKFQVMRMKKSIGVVPRIDLICIGDRKDWVMREKVKAFRSVGMIAEDECIIEEDVLHIISVRNDNDDSIFIPSQGIDVQLPLPLHMNEDKILNAISIEKDIAGFHSLNIGRLARRDDKEPLFVPCAAKACIELLRRYNVDIKGKTAVVIGTSNTVAMPTALLLQREDATVSIIHSRSKKRKEITREADIIISAVGQPNMVKGSWIKPGAVIIDFGINLVEDALLGYRLVGDVCYKEACKIASAITPVPLGGLAPMTTAMLLSNALTAAKRFYNFH